MNDELKQQTMRTLKFAGGALLFAIVSNRILAYFAGGDIYLFNVLLVVVCIFIPLAGLARLMRVRRRR